MPSSAWLPPARLREPAHRVERRAMALWAVSALLGWGLVLGLGALLVFVEGPGWSWLPWAYVAAVVLAVIDVVVAPVWRYAVHRWEYNSTAVFTRAGWWRQQRRIAPLSRVQTVDVKRGPLEQVFGLSTVQVTTASAAGAVTIEGLDSAHADQIVAELTRVTSRVRGDAT